MPEYGELAKKRELKKATAPTREMVREENLRKKRAECREEPLKDKCVPKELLLPSKSPPETVGRICMRIIKIHNGTSNLWTRINDWVKGFKNLSYF